MALQRYNHHSLGVSEVFLKKLQLRYQEHFRSQLEDLEQVLISGLADFQSELPTTQLYDFCIVANDEDKEDAKKAKDKICKIADVKGCLIYDFIQPGMSVLEAYENMMERSYKILFLITNHFNQDSFCIWLQNVQVFKGLMDKSNRKLRERCVPIFLGPGPVKMPFALTGIAGIRLYEEQCNMTGLFSRSNRDRQNLQIKYNEKLCIELMDEKVREHIKQQNEVFSFTSNFTASSSRQQIDCITSCKSEHSNEMSNLTGEQEVKQDTGSREALEYLTDALSSENLAVSDEAYAILKQVIDKQSAASSPSLVQISESSNVHIGNAIAIHVHATTTNIQQEEEAADTDG